jgi:hypothetical protein
MVTDFFGALLKEIGALTAMPGLAPDENNTCLIKFKGDILVQIEVARDENHVIVGSNLGEVSVGSYRNNLFEAALKTNGLPQPRPRAGTLAFSQYAGQLVLFELFNSKDVTGQAIADFLPSFLEKVKVWKEAIARGDTPVVATTFVPKPLGGMFGLRP